MSDIDILYTTWNDTESDNEMAELTKTTLSAPPKNLDTNKMIDSLVENERRNAFLAGFSSALRISAVLYGRNVYED